MGHQDMLWLETVVALAIMAIVGIAIIVDYFSGNKYRDDDDDST
ncbi:hypothetical protein [Klebsiella aerogenes]|nr:hypothetical protein [Klebsiella aerogenes]